MTDRTPAAVKAVLDKPGFYVFSAGLTAILEVDDKGNVYQVDPTDAKRVGMLDAEGWNDNERTQNGRIFTATRNAEGGWDARAVQ